LSNIVLFYDVLPNSGPDIPAYVGTKYLGAVQRTNESTDESPDESINKSTDVSSDECSDEITDVSIDKSTDVSTDESTDVSTDKSTDKSTDRPRPSYTWVEVRTCLSPGPTGAVTRGPR
jgi:hypothetical protein